MRAFKYLAAPAVLVAGALFASVAVAQTYPPFQDPIGNPDSLDHLKCYPVQISNAGNPDYLDGVFPVDLLNQFQLERGCEVRTPPVLFCSETAKVRLDLPDPNSDDPRGGRAGDFACFSVRCPVEGIEPTKQEDGTATKPRGVYTDQFAGRAEFQINRRNPRLVCAPVDKLRPRPPVGFPPNNPGQPD